MLRCLPSMLTPPALTVHEGRATLPFGVYDPTPAPMALGALPVLRQNAVNRPLGAAEPQCRLRDAEALLTDGGDNVCLVPLPDQPPVTRRVDQAALGQGTGEAARMDVATPVGVLIILDPIPPAVRVSGAGGTVADITQVTRNQLRHLNHLLGRLSRPGQPALSQ